MNQTALLTAALLAVVATATPSTAEDIATPVSCTVQTGGIEAQLATSRLARIHSKARNYSPRLTHQIELSSAAPLLWRLADAGAWRDAKAPAVCTPCER